MIKSVVVGGAGFIGSNVVDLLIEKNHEVVVVDNLSTGKAENINPEAEFLPLDIAASNNTEVILELRRAFHGADTVYHLAALPRVEPSIINPTESHKINVDGTYNVFWAAKLENIKRVVFSSSSSIYGNASCPTPEFHAKIPMSPYALQKLINEQYAELFCSLYGMNISCLRYFNVYGHREPTEGSYVPVIGIWLRQWRLGLPLTITGNGTQSRDFVNVLDVARANILAAEKAPPGYSCYNVGSGTSKTLNSIASLISSNIEYLPPRIEPSYTLAMINKIETELGWKSEISLEKYLLEEMEGKSNENT